jgi:hypothetical protein
MRMAYKYVGFRERMEKLTPEQRKQVMELIHKMESEDRIVVEEPDGTVHGMPVSVYEASLKKKSE